VPLASTVPNAESEFEYDADPTGSGLLQLWYDVYNAAVGGATGANMGSQVFVANAGTSCPASSTGETIMYPDEDHLPGGSAPAVALTWGISLLAVVASLALVF